MHEMVKQMADGEIRGLLGMCNNPYVSLPNQAVVRAGYEALERARELDSTGEELAELAETLAARRAAADELGGADHSA